MSTPFLFSYLTAEDAEAICKLAAGEKKNKAKEVAKIVGTGILGAGVGHLAGGLAVHAANKLHQKLYGTPIARSPSMGAVMPVLGAGAGLAYSLYKAKELEELRRALETNNNEPVGSD